MASDLTCAVLDTNVLISALLFGGKPREILRLALEREIQSIISQCLLTELENVLLKKFDFPVEKVLLLEKKIRRAFRMVYPKIEINVLRDQADNRVLEAAVEAGCNFIVTGDKELLTLGKYRAIRIVNPDQFLNVI